MNPLLKLGLCAGIAYIMWEAFHLQTAQSIPTAITGGTSSLAPNYMVTDPRLITIAIPKLSPEQRAGIDALDRAAGQPTDAELAQRFGWGGAGGFASWVDSIRTQTEEQRL